MIEIDARDLVGNKRKASPARKEMSAFEAAAAAAASRAAAVKNAIDIAESDGSETESDDEPVMMNVPPPSVPKAKKMKMALGGVC